VDAYERFDARQAAAGDNGRSRRTGNRTR
jgi:hypothetical protein